MLVLSYKYHDTGAAWAIMITELLMLVMNYHYVNKTSWHLEVFDLRTFMHAILGALLFIPIIYLIKWIVPSILWVLIISIVGCFIVYVFIQSFVIRNDFMLILKNIAFGRFRKMKDFFHH
jgi:hypothetical protein